VLYKAPLVGILFLTLDKVITAEFFVRLATFEQMIDELRGLACPFDAGVLAPAKYEGACSRKSASAIDEPEEDQ
jgi:hypothetical protein